MTAADQFRSYIFADMPPIAYGITVALSDNDSLTQRNMLDLILTEVQLNNPFFHDLVANQSSATTLIGRLFKTLLRKDISLTKRVNTWLLDGHEGDEAIEFRNHYSKHLILLAIDKEIEECLKSASTNADLDYSRENFTVNGDKK